MSPCTHDCKPYDSVITIGGLQSNHARTTAVVARQLGYAPHLILRGPTEEDPAYDTANPQSLVGNLLFDRMVGAEVHRVSVEAYQAAEGG